MLSQSGRLAAADWMAFNLAHLPDSNSPGRKPSERPLEKTRGAMIMTLAMLQFGMMFRSGIVVLALAVTTWAQVPSPTPADQRGIGVQGQGTNKSATATPQGKEAKPELVLQT